MPITQDVIHAEYCDGQLVADPVVEVRDVTAECVVLDLHQKARAALASNLAYLALANPGANPIALQVRRLTLQVNALIRLQIGADLLDDEAGDT
jgi:hypothetical protein